MADEEQFSLCWNNFNSNLSAGFHESLCRGDLVDVTLAAEGQLVKAHRLVLSVCSPYFRKMFTQMPANQHAFVFLKDVSHAALKDLIQFMYCGEVNVKQDALPTFISTAEALQIKGLTETGEPATPASSQTPVKVSTPAPSVASTTATTSPRSRVQRNISRTSYKLESEDSSDDKPAPVVAQKRLISRSITPVTAPALKRTKNSDPLEASEPTSQQQIITTIETKSNAEETEFIDLPMETMPTKSEPDYGDDTGEVEAVDQDTTYVEDDSGDYGDMKYDASYFTENDDVKAGASGFAEPYAETGDQSANEAQGVVVEEYVITEYDTKRRCVNMGTTQKSKNILPEFPFKNPADLQLFELDCMVDDDLVVQLRNKFAEIGGQDVAKFVRQNLRNLLTDEAALPYSWHGHRGNIAVCQFVSMDTLIDTCQQHFRQSETAEIVKTIKLWFQYAGDRIKKRSSANV